MKKNKYITHRQRLAELKQRLLILMIVNQAFALLVLVVRIMSR